MKIEDWQISILNSHFSILAMMVIRRIFRSIFLTVGVFCWCNLCLQISIVSAQFVSSAWPQNTGAPVNSSPVLGDLDGDGMLEIVVGSDNNKVYAWKPDGTLMPGWPVTTGDSVRSSPALADIDGDGRLDVIVGSFDNKVYAWNFHGSLLPGWPAVTGSVVYSSPAVGDIDGDQLPEIVVGSFDNKVYAWNADGTLARGWPKPTGLFVYSSPALADLDGDGILDVIVGTDNNRVFAWKGDGTELEGWPTATEHVVPSSPAVGDIDNDGNLEVVVGSWDKVFVWNSQGERKPGWPVTAGHQIPSSPALADLNNDGHLEIIIGCKDGKVYVWDAKGQFLPGWPTVTDAEISASPVVADLNGDGRLEIIIGSKDQKVYIWDVEGRLLPGWPKATGGSIAASPAVADLDGDGTLEVVAGSKDQQVYVWSFPRTGSVTPRIAWQNFHGDPAHSGTYGFRPPTIIATVAMPVRPTDTPVPVTSAPDVRIIAAYPGATPQISGGSQAPTSEILPVTQTPIIPREILAGYISDLVISDYQGNTVTLTWTTPSGAYSPNAVYTIRYAAQPITEETWATAVPYPAQIPLSAPGSREVQQLADLKAPDNQPIDMIYLAVRIIDETQAFPLSNVVRFERQDSIPPTRIVDLKVTELNDALLELSWTAVGDDGPNGTAVTYDIRYAEVPLTDLTWMRAIQIEGEPAPLPAGTDQRFQVPKPWNDREIFWGIKVIDDALNISDLSEVAVWSPRDTIPPARIVDLHVTHISGTTVTLSWTAPGSSLNMGKAARYEIRYSDFPITDDIEWLAATLADNPPEPAEAGTIQSYELPDIPIGETVFVGIKAIDHNGNASALSNVIETAMDDLMPPAAVTDLSIEQVGKDWARLSWTAVGSDGHQNLASAYVLRYGGTVRAINSWHEAIDVPDLPVPAHPGTKETALISGLNENTTYFVALRVLDNQGNTSELSNILRFKTLGYSTPASVTDLVIEELRPDKFTLNWTAPQDFGEDSPQVSRYDLRYARTEITEETWESAEIFTHSLSPSPPETLETLTLPHAMRDTTSYVALKSVDALGNISALSNVVQVPQVDTLPPDGVIDLAVDDTGEDWIRLSWTAAGDDGQQGQASAVHIRLAPTLNQLKGWDQAIDIPNSLQPSLAGTKDSFTITGLKPDSTFFVALKSVDDFGNTSDMSNIVRASTKDAEPPAPITDLRVVSSESGNILLEWTAVGEDGMQGQAKTYDIRYAPDPVTLQNWNTLQAASLVPRPAPAGSRETLSLPDPLLPNTTYYIAIVVSDASGNQSPLSNMVTVTTADTIAPHPITTLAVEMVDQSSVLLRWNSPGDDNVHDTPADYEIRYSQQTLTEATWQQANLHPDSPIPSSKGEPEQFLLSGLQPNVRYEFGIKAIDTDGNVSALSNIVQVSTSPGNVTDLRIPEFSGENVTFAWTAPGGVLSGDERHYDIRYATSRITDATWDEATSLATITPVNQPGHAESATLNNVPVYEQMFFALRVVQQQPGPMEGKPSLSKLSNVVELNRLDLIAPSEITDLAITDLGDASAGIRSLAFSWTASGDNDYDGTATRYELRYGTLPPTTENWNTLNMIQDVPSPDISGTPQHATVQVPYHEDKIYFALRAFDEALNVSDVSNVVQWGPEDFTPPAAILDLAASRLPNGDIHVTWTAPGDNRDRGVAAFYDIRYALKESDLKKWENAQVVPGEPLPESAGTHQEYTITGLEPGRSYYVAMKTVDQAKNISELSNIVEVSKVLPPSVTDLAFAGGTETSVTLSWTAPGTLDADGRIARYDIRFSEDPESVERWDRATRVRHSLTPNTPGATEAITIEKLSPNRRYYVALKSIDVRGETSLLSNIAVADTVDTIPPNPVTDLAVTQTTKDSVTLGWTVQADDATHDRPDVYDLRYSLEPIDENTWTTARMADAADQTLKASASGSLMNYTITGLAENTRYYFAVRAIDNSGNLSPLSGSVVGRTADLTPPEAIPDLQALFPTATSVLLAWTVPTDATGTQAGGSGSENETSEVALFSEDAQIASYEIRYLALSEEGALLNDASWESAQPILVPPTPLLPGAVQEFVVPNLAPATAYTFALKAVDRSGNRSLLSNVALQTTLPEEFASLPPTPTEPPSEALGWEIVQGQAFADLHHDEFGVMAFKSKNAERAIPTSQAITAVYPRNNQQVSVHQGEFVLQVKSSQEFIICAQVVASADGEMPYTLCYTPSSYLARQAQTSETQETSLLPRKRIDQYVYYALDPDLTDDQWHDLRLNLAQDLLAGTGLLYQRALRFSVRGAELSLKNMSMQGEVLTSVDDFEKGLYPLDTGWKLHFGAGVIRLAQETDTPLIQGIEVRGTGGPNNFLYAKSETDQALVLTYPRDASARVSDKPILVANVKANKDFKMILKISTKDQREYYLAYVPQAEFQSMASPGNYIYMPLDTMSDSQQTGWQQIRANIAADLRKHQLEYDHTSWISFHGKEFSLDNVGFSTERLQTNLQ